MHVWHHFQQRDYVFWCLPAIWELCKKVLLTIKEFLFRYWWVLESLPRHIRTKHQLWGFFYICPLYSLDIILRFNTTQFKHTTHLVISHHYELNSTKTISFSTIINPIKLQYVICMYILQCITMFSPAASTMFNITCTGLSLASFSFLN